MTVREVLGLIRSHRQHVQLNKGIPQWSHRKPSFRYG